MSGPSAGAVARGCVGSGGGTWPDGGGRLGSMSAGSTQTARANLLSRRVSGLRRRRRRARARRSRPGWRTALVAAGAAALGGGQHPGPQLAAAPVAQRDRHRRAHRAASGRASHGGTAWRGRRRRASPAGASGYVTVAPAATASARPRTPSGCSSHWAARRRGVDASTQRRERAAARRPRAEVLCRRAAAVRSADDGHLRRSATGRKSPRSVR